MTLAFKQVTHYFGDTKVLSKFNLVATAGDITCLFGGSGSGKSTLLRIAAGIEPLQHGTLELDGQRFVTPEHQPAPEARPVGLMFQENALFPHMSIGDNIAFGIRHKPRAERALCVEFWLDEIQMSGYGKRYPHTLSGGQIQRVALARSLAPAPKVLLMDEPFASIDTVLRRKLRETTRRLIKKSGCIAIFVTHDPSEALEIADSIAVLEQGQISQHDVPETIFKHPKTQEVAELFGDAVAVSATQVSEGFESDYGLIRGLIRRGSMKPNPTQSGPEQRSGAKHGKPCTLLIRPHTLQLQADTQSNTKVQDIRFAGDHWLALVAPDDVAEPLRVVFDASKPVKIGDRVSLQLSSREHFILD